MKKYLLFLFLLWCMQAHSQPYSCILPGVKRFFTNSQGYLRGIRIDSVHTYPDSTVYHFFRTTRVRAYVGYTASLDTNGACWMGRSAIAYSNGTWRFHNIWGRPLTLKPLAAPGTSWMFYSDTSDVYYMAKVLSLEEQLVHGVPDSVRTIRISAWSHSTGTAVPDPASGLRIAISKNHGLTEAFDLYPRICS